MRVWWRGRRAGESSHCEDGLRPYSRTFARMPLRVALRSKCRHCRRLLARTKAAAKIHVKRRGVPRRCLPSRCIPLIIASTYKTHGLVGNARAMASPMGRNVGRCRIPRNHGQKPLAGFYNNTQFYTLSFPKHPHSTPSVPTSYLRPTILLPASLHVRISLAKSEHEATQVGGWY